MTGSGTIKLPVLISERNPLWSDFITELVQGILPPGKAAAVICPNGIGENDLLSAAEEYEWAFAIIVLNNILYSGDRSEGGASLNLVRNMVSRFQRPLIACYGWPDAKEYPQRVLDAGAKFVFRLPFTTGEIREAVATCLASTFGAR
jgi:hypothetical protein